MNYEYDLICIGLGPAGMAVSVMGAEMGLKVCSIEKNKIGGECMNVGCIPSKALLKAAFIRDCFRKLELFGFNKGASIPELVDVFEKISSSVKYINDKKTMGMFSKVELILNRGEASFVDEHTVKVGELKVTGKRIFVAVGTEPAVPPIPGLEDVEYFTNKNIFDMSKPPASMIIIGGGVVGCELGQAFSRLGCKCVIAHQDGHLLPYADKDAGDMLEKYFHEEGIGVYNSQKIAKVEKTANGVRVYTESGITLESEKLLVAAGRKLDIRSLALENAGVRYNKNGIFINNYLQTNKKHIYAVGDCNGKYLLTHAAMHQGMLALMNAMIPWPFKIRFDKFAVPWTVFTEPEVSGVGLNEIELKAKGIKYEVVESGYGDYGAAIAEHDEKGSVRAYVSALGKIYGVSITGKASGEMVNEWALAVQKGIRLYDIMFLQHSFPTMGFLTKRISEQWMMRKMRHPLVKKMIKFFYYLG